VRCAIHTSTEKGIVIVMACVSNQLPLILLMRSYKIFDDIIERIHRSMESIGRSVTCVGCQIP